MQGDSTGTWGEPPASSPRNLARLRSLTADTALRVTLSQGTIYGVTAVPGLTTQEALTRWRHLTSPLDSLNLSQKTFLPKTHFPASPTLQTTWTTGLVPAHLGASAHGHTHCSPRGGTPGVRAPSIGQRPTGPGQRLISEETRRRPPTRVHGSPPGCPPCAPLHDQEQAPGRTLNKRQRQSSSPRCLYADSLGLQGKERPRN